MEENNIFMYCKCVHQDAEELKSLNESHAITNKSTAIVKAYKFNIIIMYITDTVVQIISVKFLIVTTVTN